MKTNSFSTSGRAALRELHSCNPKLGIKKGDHFSLRLSNTD